MNRRNVMLVAGAVIGVGLVLIIGAFAMGSFDPKKLSTTETVEESRTFEEVVSCIDIQAVASDVRFERSSDGKTRVESRHDAQIRETVEIKNGVLTVRQEQTKKGLNIGIDLSSEDDKLTLYLPQSEYDSLTIQTVSGDVALDGMRVKRAEVGSVSGELELRNLIVEKEMTVGSVSGDVALEGCDAPDLTIETVSGEVEGTLRSGKKFEVHTVSGKISVPESESGAGRCTINTTSGDVSLRVLSD